VLALPTLNFLALFRIKGLFIPSMKNSRALRRFLSAGILLFVFFLPLHFHFTATTQGSEECACCYYGGRVQMDLPPAATIVGSFALLSLLILPTTEAPVQVTLESELARAPPYFLTS
jgi:hypothetical protein